MHGGVDSGKRRYDDADVHMPAKFVGTALGCKSRFTFAACQVSDTCRGAGAGRRSQRQIGGPSAPWLDVL